MYLIWSDLVRDFKIIIIIYLKCYHAKKLLLISLLFIMKGIY